MTNYVLSESLKFDNLVLMAENQLYRIDIESTKKASNKEFYSEEAMSYLGIYNEAEEATENKTNKIKEILKKIWTAIQNFFVNLGKSIANFFVNLINWIRKVIAKIKAKSADKKAATSIPKFITAKYSTDSLDSFIKNMNTAATEATSKIDIAGIVNGNSNAIAKINEANSNINEVVKINEQEESLTPQQALQYISKCELYLSSINKSKDIGYKLLKASQNATKQLITETDKLQSIENPDHKSDVKEKVKAISLATKISKNIIVKYSYYEAKIVRSALNNVVSQILKGFAPPSIENDSDSGSAQSNSTESDGWD